MANFTRNSSILCVALATVLTLSAENSFAKSFTVQDFIDAQGTFCFPDGAGGCLYFVPPDVSNDLGFSAGIKQPSGKPEKGFGLNASVDYAAIESRWIEENGGALPFDTTYSGAVSVRPLEDGRFEFNVRVKVKNALTWIIEGGDYAADPIVFGNRPADVLNGAEAGLCTSVLQLRFINADEEIPDIIQLLAFPEPGQELLFLGLNCVANGPLADGTPGMANIKQRGIFLTNFKGALADAFPVEFIQVIPK